MAELPRYRPLGVAIPSIPTVDFVSTGRAQARVYENISRGLDVMQRYVATKEEAKTKFEAEQWAYDQDLSAEQLQAALSAGRSIEEIIGDPTTVFGSVSIASTASKLKTELEAGVRSQLAALSAKVDGGADIDLMAEITAINGVQAGHTELLSQLDPTIANAFSASVATMAAPVYSKALEREIKMSQAIAKAKGLDAMAGALQSFEDIYRTDKGGVVFLSDEQLRLLDDDQLRLLGDRASILRTEGEADNLQRSISDQLIATNDASFATTEMSKFEGIRTTAKINVLTEHAVNLPEEKRLSALRTGDFGDKTALFNTLDETSKAVLRKQVRDEIIARQNADDKARADGVLTARQDTVLDVLTFMDNDDGSVEANDALGRLAETAMNYPEVIDGQGIVALAKSKQTIRQAGYYEEENPSLVFKIKTLIRNGQIVDFFQLAAKAEELGLGPKQTNGLTTYLDSTQLRINNAVDDEARKHAGLTTGMINVKANQAKTANSFIANVERRFDDAVAAWQEGGETGSRPRKDVIAREYRLELASSKYQKVIDATLSSLNEKYGDVFNEYTTTEEVRANQRAWGISDADLTTIISKISTVQKNIVLRDELR